MPRVTDAHVAARRQQILDAARTCFVRNGFHTTSMQDVIRTAGLSVGAVYRYFPSKNDLIAALAEQVIDDVGGVFEALAATGPPPPLAEVIHRAVDLVTAETGPDGTLRLALQVWSESLRDPVLADFVDRVFRRLREGFVRLAWRAQEHGHLPPTADPAAVGAVLFALMPGYALQRIFTGEPESEPFADGVRALLGASHRDREVQPTEPPTANTPAQHQRRARAKPAHSATTRCRDGDRRG